ncbi:MAG: hypothetical protein JWN62_2557 [Acidimicrobiales bacterium]|jgi:hypothetical protein|nr:hypothetical protein [Acidimicrobiales bacterium]
MVTLKCYAEKSFPGRPVDVDNDAPFDEHTTSDR